MGGRGGEKVGGSEVCEFELALFEFVNLQQKAVFLSVAQDAADSKGATLKSWDSLCDFAAQCLGRRDDIGTINPSGAASMWEEYAGPVIDAF